LRRVQGVLSSPAVRRRRRRWREVCQRDLLSQGHPRLGIEVNRRSTENGQEAIGIPVQLTLQAAPRIAAFVDMGLFGPTNQFGSRYTIPVGVGGDFLLRHGFDVGVEFMFRRWGAARLSRERQLTLARSCSTPSGGILSHLRLEERAHAQAKSILKPSGKTAMRARF